MPPSAFFIANDRGIPLLRCLNSQGWRSKPIKETLKCRTFCPSPDLATDFLALIPNQPVPAPNTPFLRNTARLRYLKTHCISSQGKRLHLPPLPAATTSISTCREDETCSDDTCATSICRRPMRVFGTAQQRQHSAVPLKYISIDQDKNLYWLRCKLIVHSMSSVYAAISNHLPPRGLRFE